MQRYRVRVYERELGFDRPIGRLIVDEKVDAFSRDDARLKAEDLCWYRECRGTAFAHFDIQETGR